MYTTDRATAHQVLATLATLDHPVRAFEITGQFVPLTEVKRHQAAVREALEIIGTTDAAEALAAPGRMAVAGARQRIGSAVKFLSQYGL